MEITQFTEAHNVHHAISELKENWREDRQISDIIDDDGHQYVDLVLEGGGVLGIALLGYTFALESVGIRFLGVGGTSAGAIAATMIAAVDKPANAKSERVLGMLADLEMFEFVDGDSDAKDFVKSMLDGAGPMKLAWKGWQVTDNLREDGGLNPGDYFLNWVTQQLKSAGVRTVADLKERCRDLPSSIGLRSGKKLSAEEAKACLKIVAADVTTETKVVFPEMAHLYFKKPEKVNPAHFVRASMSIPLFFHPYRVSGHPKGTTALDDWRKTVGYVGRIPKEIVFIDGGIMSNFPVDLFHDPKPGVPIAPTLGARLGSGRAEPNKTEKVTQLLMSIFNAARHCNDYDYIASNPDFAQLVTEIPTGEHNWLNFFLSPEAKIDLFARGVQAATAWLMKFDWPQYKKFRAQMAQIPSP
jgi:NTE family protein